MNFVKIVYTIFEVFNKSSDINIDTLKNIIKNQTGYHVTTFIPNTQPKKENSVTVGNNIYPKHATKKENSVTVGNNIYPPGV